MLDTIFRYRLFDENATEDLDLNGSCNVVAQIIEAALRKESYDITITPRPDGYKSELEVRGLPPVADEYQHWCLINDTIDTFGDDIWVLVDDSYAS